MTARQSYPDAARRAAQYPDTTVGQQVNDMFDEIDELRALCDRLVEVEEMSPAVPTDTPNTATGRPQANSRTIEP